MAKLVVLAWLLYLAVAVVFRAWLQLRMTGRTGIVFASSAPPLEWLAGALLVAAVVLAVAAAVAAWLATPPAFFAVLEAAPSSLAVGAVLYVVGLWAMLGAQLSMGRSWRMGIERGEHTELIVHGPFRWVRNPIYGAMLATQTGLAMLLPSPAACVALAALFVALELQVRLVEEPHLARVHGEAYLRYAARTGRFVPGLGRLPPAA